MKNVLLAALVAAFVHGAAWILTDRVVSPPDLANPIDSVSYNLLTPDERQSGEVTDEQLARARDDMAVIAKLAHSVRLYSMAGAHTRVPELAREHGLTVTVGAWISKDEESNRKEMEAAITAVRHNSNVRAVVVGNETVLRKERTVAEITQDLRYVRKRVRVPVSTGETWDIWLANPALVREVDFIAAHVLPYWEGFPVEMAVDYAFERYDLLRKAFPGKKIVIAEFGWPSQGYNFKMAVPDPVDQAEVLRKFIVEANKRGVPFNIIEALDQPWKTREGSVGAYWGVLDASRNLKFSLSGLVEQPSHLPAAVVALVVGLIASVGGLWGWRPTFAHAMVFTLSANAMASAVGLAAVYPIENYLTIHSAMAWLIGFLLMIPLTIMTLVKVNEMASVIVGRRPQRLLKPSGKPAAGAPTPMVSVHVPAYREPPEMLKATLDSLARLDYPDFEVLVVVNNTPEEAFWKPIETHCAQLGERFKFVFLPKVDGFKAGALNKAMAWMDPRAEVIALLDADYVVHPHWLRDLVPAFADPKVALVQAPQDHRDGRQNLFKTVMNSEYAGFFDIGMVQRNEDDAIIAHGTMLLIRRSAFDEVGGWATDTITEDTELGLRLFEAGYAAHYTNVRYGWGLLPDTYLAFKTQRHRWAYGAMQIIRKHWRHFLPGSTTMTPARKRQFVAGWSYWLSDAFGVVAAAMNLIWVPMILFVGVLIPMIPFTVPILVAFAVNLLHCVVLYLARVSLPPAQIIGAALSAMSLQYTVARAVFQGLFKDGLAFMRTEKGGATKRQKTRRVVRSEMILGSMLAVSSLVLVVFNPTEMRELYLFAATLAVQSLPLLSAGAMHLLERHIERRQAALEARAVAGATVPAE